MCVGLMVQGIGILMDEVISKEEIMGRVRKLKNGKSASIDEITGEMIKNGGEMVIDWIWKLCNKSIMEGIVSRDWRKAVIVPLDKGKGDKGNCKKFIWISLLSVVGKIYTGILVERERRVTEGLIVKNKVRLEVVDDVWIT